jgi:hypothetical protein
MAIFSSKKASDVEAAPIDEKNYVQDHSSGDFVADDGAVPAETFVMGDSWIAKTQRLAGKLGVEQRGIERGQ